MPEHRLRIPRSRRGLVSGLRSVGYTPGQDISIVWCFSNGHPEQLPSLAAELVQLQVDLIVTPAPPDTAAAARATQRCRQLRAPPSLPKLVRST